MPTYEYACTSCGRHFEVVQRFSDEPLETCEVCQGKLKRVFHPVGILLKGSGFYATDNRTGKALNPPSKDEKSSTTTESKPEKKTESKPSTKTDKK